MADQNLTNAELVQRAQQQRRSVLDRAQVPPGGVQQPAPDGQAIADEASLWDAVTQRIQQLELERNQLRLQPVVVRVDLTRYNDVNNLITRREAVAGATFEQVRRELAQLVRTELLTVANTLAKVRDTTVEEELYFYRNVGGRTQADVRNDMKALNSIPVFTGDDGDVAVLDAKWRTFELPFIMAVRNRHISEEDLRTALISRLQGKAGIFFMGQANNINMSFGEILTACRKRYVIGKTQAQVRVKSVRQKEKDTVQDYVSQLNVTALSMLPSPPRRLKSLVTNGHPDTGVFAYPIPNPLEQEETREYQDRLSVVQNGMIGDFVGGLKPQIRQKMQTLNLNTIAYQEAIDAAVQAEEWLGMYPGEVSRVTYHTEDDAGASAQVHVLNQPGKKGGCFNCGDPNHWRRECPQLKNGKNDQGKNDQFVGRTSGNNRVWNQNSQSSVPVASGRGSTRGSFRGSFRGSSYRGYRGRGGYGGRRFRNLPRDYRNPQRRQWMVNTRAAFNRRINFRNKLHNLTAEEEEPEIMYTEEEDELFNFEDEAQKDEQWFQQYQDDVFSIEDQCEAKNG